MKNTFKKLAVLASMVVMMAATSISAYAAENRNDGVWKQNETGWWYEFVDGSYLTNGWYWVDGNHDEVYECYYFDGNGYMAANTTIGSDMVDANGAWVVNGVVQTKKLAATDNHVVDQADDDVEKYVPATRNIEKSESVTVDLPSLPNSPNLVDWFADMDESTSTSTFGGTFITY